jgi:type IV secretion system protein VirB10
MEQTEDARRKSKSTSGQKIIMFFLVIALITIAFVFMAANAQNVQNRARRNTAEEERAASFADTSVLENELFAAASRGKAPAAASSGEAAPEQQPVSYSTPKNQIVIMPPSSQRQARRRPLSDSEKQLAKRFQDMKSSAILSKSEIDGFVSAQGGGGAQQQPPAQAHSQYGASSMSPEAIQAMLSAQEAQTDKNAQQHKLDFLTTEAAGRTPQGYSNNTRMPQAAILELKAGSLIPGLLVTGVNSDLPGTVLGQVSENVYDTATGRYLLIPQGTRILGVYDSRVTFGQKRVGIVWNRLIYPDGSSLNISGSPGTDLAGYSGIKGAVDNHYGQLLSAALFVSIFASAAEISTGGDTNSGNENKSVKDVMTETAGATIAELGAKLANRALDIQPTIKIKPGSRFNVMLQQDFVFLQAWNPGTTRVSGF